jgi:hypothetical protein
MRVLQWICWLRGYHVAFFKVDKVETDGQGATYVHGNAMPCRICGREAKVGNWPRGYTLVQFVETKE